MLTIGLTGSFGTGKTTVARMFQKCGAKVLDADKIAHDLMGRHSRSFKKILRSFGPEILTHGQINRKKLGKAVFRDERLLKRLTAILHPEVILEIKKNIAHARKNKPVIVIDAPLLIEAGIHRFSDILIVVKADRSQQLLRLKKRGIPRAEALRRIKVQMPLAAKIRMADIVIDNRGNLNQTKKQVEEIWQRLLRKKKT